VLAPTAQQFGLGKRLSTVDVTMDAPQGPDEIAPPTGTLRRSHSASDAGVSVSELFRDYHLELVRLSQVRG